MLFELARVWLKIFLRGSPEMPKKKYIFSERVLVISYVAGVVSDHHRPCGNLCSGHSLGAVAARFALPRPRGRRVIYTGRSECSPGFFYDGVIPGSRHTGEITYLDGNTAPAPPVGASTWPPTLRSHSLETAWRAQTGGALAADPHHLERTLAVARHIHSGGVRR